MNIICTISVFSCYLCRCTTVVGVDGRKWRPCPERSLSSTANSSASTDIGTRGAMQHDIPQTHNQARPHTKHASGCMCVSRDVSNHLRWVSLAFQTRTHDGQLTSQERMTIKSLSSTNITSSLTDRRNTRAPEPDYFFIFLFKDLILKIICMYVWNTCCHWLFVVSI